MSLMDAWAEASSIVALGNDLRKNLSDPYGYGNGGGGGGMDGRLSKAERSKRRAKNKMAKKSKKRNR